MQQVYLFSLAKQNASWLHARESLVAGNVANADTPGYKGSDLKPFASFLDQSSTLTTTDPAHISPTSTVVSDSRPTPNDFLDATLSGNSVSLEGEMIKLSEINRSLSLNTGIQRLFHQMLLAATK